MNGQTLWVTSTFSIEGNTQIINSGWVLTTVSDPVVCYLRWSSMYNRNIFIFILILLISCIWRFFFFISSIKGLIEWGSMSVLTLVDRWWSLLMTVHLSMSASTTMTSIPAKCLKDSGCSMSIPITEADSICWDLVNTEDTVIGVPYPQGLVPWSALPIQTEKLKSWSMKFNQ